jgi:hypothetical protein
MTKMIIDLPDELVAALPCNPEDATQAVRLAAALYWCGRGELSVGWGAMLAGLTYAGFMEAAAQQKCQLFPLDIDELDREIVQLRLNGAEVEKIKEELARAQSSRC